MITEQTIKQARTAAAELRRAGDADGAMAIEALIDAVGEGASSRLAPEQIGDLVGVDGSTLKQWVQEGRYQAYRAGALIVSRDTVEDYVRRAGPSLDLEVISDDDAARLVAEGRTKGEPAR